MVAEHEGTDVEHLAGPLGQFDTRAAGQRVFEEDRVRADQPLAAGLPPLVELLERTQPHLPKAVEREAQAPQELLDLREELLPGVNFAKGHFGEHRHGPGR